MTTPPAAPLNYPYTRPDIIKLFAISDPTFWNWKKRGLFGDPIGLRANISPVGKGSPLQVYSARVIENLYDENREQIEARRVYRNLPHWTGGSILGASGRLPEVPDNPETDIPGKVDKFDIPDKSPKWDDPDVWDIYYLTDNRYFPDSFVGAPMPGCYMMGT